MVLSLSLSLYIYIYVYMDICICMYIYIYTHTTGRSDNNFNNLHLKGSLDINQLSTCAAEYAQSAY